MRNTLALDMTNSPHLKEHWRERTYFVFLPNWLSKAHPPMHIQSNVEREQERKDQIHLFQLMCLDLLLMFRDALSRRSKKQKKTIPKEKGKIHFGFWVFREHPTKNYVEQQGVGE